MAESRRLPNRYRTTGSNPDLDRPDLEADEYSGIADSFRTGIYGQIYSRIEEDIAAGPTVSNDDTFMGTSNIPKGYEAYADAFVGARNMNQVRTIKRNIDENLAVRARREARGFGSTLLSDIGSGIVDPANAVAPALRGAGFVMGAIKGAGLIGGSGAAQEILRGNLDPTSTLEETAMGAGASFVLGGLLGGGVGMLKAPKPRTTVPMSEEAAIAAFKPLIRRAESGGDNQARPRNADGSLRSSALGPYQFVDNTFVDFYGRTFGKTEETRAQILAKRTDFAVADKVMDTLTRHNVRILKNIGVEVTPGTIYTMHFAGQGNGPRLLRSDPKALAADVIDPKTRASVLKANPEVYKKGKATVGEVLAWARNAVGDKTGPVGRAVSGLPDVRRGVSLYEGIQIPNEVDINGRGVKVLIGRGALNDDGSYSPAKYMPARQVPRDEAALDDTVVIAPTRDAMKPLDGDLADEIADARARLAALEEADTRLLARLAEDNAALTELMVEAATVGIDRVSKPKRRKIAKALAEDSAKAKPRARGRTAKKVKEIESELTEKAEVRTQLRIASESAATVPVPMRETVTVKKKIYSAKGKLIRTEEVEVPKSIAYVAARDPDRADFVPARDFDPRPIRTEIGRARQAAAAAFKEGDKDAASRLAAYADDLEDELTGGGTGIDNARLIDEQTRDVTNVDVLANTADDELAQLSAADLEARKRGLFGDQTGDAGDSIPFGARRGSEGDDLPDDYDEHIRIDPDAIIKSFNEKPWTAPNIPGVDPLPENAFSSPAEYLNFVFLHEREHTVNPRMPDEDIAAYENRVNARAMEDLRGGQASFSPTNSELERLALRPTPIGQLMALLRGNENAAIFKDIQDLAGDMSTTLIANRTSGATAAGGSVFQRVMRWQALQVDLRFAMNTSWNKYLGSNAEVGEMSAELTRFGNMVGRVAQREGKLSEPEFKEAVTLAQVDPSATSYTPKGGAPVPIPAQAREAAAALNAINQKFAKAMDELVIGQGAKSVDRQATRLETSATKIRRMLDDPKNEQLPDGVRDRLEEIYTSKINEAAVVRADGQASVMPYKETNYFTRIWDIGELKANADDALNMLQDAYLKFNGDGNAVRARMQAEGALKVITEEGDDAIIPGSAAYAKHRSIPITNAEAFKYIVKDPELVFSIYAQRMGTAIEMTRRFGSAAALDHGDTLEADMLMRGVPAEKVEKAMQIWGDARDRIAGGFHGIDPMRLDARAVRTIKGFANLSTMGSVIFSQIGDIGHSIATAGPKPLLQTVAMGITGQLRGVGKGPLAKLSGEALEFVMARTNADRIDNDTALLVTRQTLLERGVAKAQYPFFMANLMIPFTVLMKEMMSVVSTHVLIKEINEVAGAIRSGATPNNATATRLATLGIDRQDVQLLADVMKDRSFKNGSLNFANIDSWAEAGERGARARELFLGAINGELRRAVITPGPLDRPAILDGVFISPKRRAKAKSEAQVAQRAVDIAYEDIKDARASGASDEEIDALITQAAELRLVAYGLKRTIDQKARVEAPLLSLPFQLQSFALAAGGKNLHGILSGRDRARFSGLLAMFAAGVLATWMQSPNGFKYTEAKDIDDIALSAFNKSGIPSWLGSVVQAVNRLADIDETLGIADAPKEGRETVSEKISAVAGPGAGLAAGIIEAFVGDDLSDETRRSLIRRAVPMNNLVWWDQTVKAWSMAGLDPEALDQFDEDYQDSGDRVAGDTPLDALVGFTSRDLRQRPEDDAEPVRNPQLDTFALDIEDMVTARMAELQAKRPKKTRARRSPVSAQADSALSLETVGD